MVKGKTPEERAVARAEKRRRERRRYFSDEVRDALNGRAALRHACRFAQAVGERELDDAGRTALALEVVLTVNRVAAARSERGDAR